MGERYQDVEKSSVRLRDAILSSQPLMMRDMIVTKIFLKSLVILMERRRHPSFCWQVVRTRVLYLPDAWVGLLMLNQCRAAILLRP